MGLNDKIIIQTRLKKLNCLLAFALLIIILMPQVTRGACITCHAEEWEKAQQQPFVHAPVTNKQCSACHHGDIDDNSLSQTTNQEQTTENIIAAFDQPEQVDWIAETFTPQTRHLALLPQEYAESKLTLELWSAQREKLNFTIEVPPFTDLDPVIPPAPATIESIHLHEYNIMLLSRATLSWFTTCPCRCRISYGSTGDEYQMAEEDLYDLEHQLDVKNFSQNDLFHISCIDPYGRILDYKETKLTSLPLQPHPKTIQQAMLTQQQITTVFKQFNQQIWLELSAPQLFSVSIGTTDQKDLNQQSTETIDPPIALETVVPTVPGSAMVNLDNNSATTEHNGLLSAQDLNIAICYRCHTNIKEWSSHPVDVIAPPGMIIPKDYPLLSGGKLSCMTCHTVHGGDKEYRLLKDSKKLLCTGCHTNY
jgi:predicted CXXCH cytochrome family protein